jgi:hypothetical protein
MWGCGPGEGIFMSVDRVPQVPFAQIANTALRDTRLSFRARGVLAMVLSHPGEWKANRDFIVSKSDKDGQKAVQSALNELNELGYRQVVKRQKEDGTWESYVQWSHQPTDCDYTDRSVSQPSVPVTANKNTIKNKERCSYCRKPVEAGKKHYCPAMNMKI